MLVASSDEIAEGEEIALPDPPFYSIMKLWIKMIQWRAVKHRILVAPTCEDVLKGQKFL